MVSSRRDQFNHRKWNHRLVDITNVVCPTLPPPRPLRLEELYLNKKAPESIRTELRQVLSYAPVFRVTTVVNGVKDTESACLASLTLP